MIGVIDVIDWQTVVNLKTGTGISADKPLVQLARELQKDHSYPGDQSTQCSKWVTDTALDLSHRYCPDLMILDYAYPALRRLFGTPSKREWKETVDTTIASVDAFINTSGFEPIIIGSGDMIPVQGSIDLSSLECLTATGGPSPTQSGLFSPSAADLEMVHAHPHVRSVLPKEELMEKYDFCAAARRRFPEHLAIAEPGYIFRGLGSTARPVNHIPGYNTTIPVSTALGKPTEITDTKALIEQRLAEKKKVALIIIEGIGTAEFPYPFTQCGNTFHWHAYSPGTGQYAALMTGKHLPQHPYPPGYLYFPEDGEDREYPFSGPFGELPMDSLGAECNCKSAAVGNRSTFTHVYAGTDIAIECFARNLYNYGTMAVIRRDGTRP